MGTDKELSDLLDFSMVSQGTAFPRSRPDSVWACSPRFPGAEASARNTSKAQSQTSNLGGWRGPRWEGSWRIWGVVGVHGLWASSGLGLVIWKMGMIRVIHFCVGTKGGKMGGGTEHQDDWRGA